MTRSSNWKACDLRQWLKNEKRETRNETEVRNEDHKCQKTAAPSCRCSPRGKSTPTKPIACSPHWKKAPAHPLLPSNPTPNLAQSIFVSSLTKKKRSTTKAKRKARRT